MLKSKLVGLAFTQIRAISKRPDKKTNIIRKTSYVVREGPPLITCKRREFDLYRTTKVNSEAKYKEIPLASAGWQHYKSKNDYFIIHSHADEKELAHSSKYVVPFESLGIEKGLVNNLKSRFGIEETTYIQHETIPKILNGDHTLIAAETGCGKTLAYLVPIVQKIIERKRLGIKTYFNQPQALILTPGRELAEQIGEVARNLGHEMDINVEVIIGGSTKQKMLYPTLKEVDIVVGTLGVISKLTTNKIYQMNEVRHVVLDEFDTLLDDSFLDQLSYYLKRFPVSKRPNINSLNKNVLFYIEFIF